MKTRYKILSLALATACPMTLHGQGEAGELGHPAKDKAHTETTEETTPTDQPTGARETADLGTPGKAIQRTERDTVDAAGTIADALRDADNLTHLHDLVEAAELEATLEGEGPYTVFAPSDEAIEAIPEAERDQWMEPENQKKLQQVLLGHVMGGVAVSTSLSDGNEVATAGGTTLKVTRADEKVMIGSAAVVQSDIRVENGVIHIIDAVLMPADEE